MKKDTVINDIDSLLTGCRFITFGFIIPLLWMVSCTTSKTIPNKSDEGPGLQIIFTGQQVADSVYVTVTPIPTDTNMFLKEYLAALHNGRKDAYAVKNRRVCIRPDSVPSVYSIQCDNYTLSNYYMRRSDNLKLTVGNLSPSKYEITGGIYEQPIPNSKEFFSLITKLYKISRYKLTSHELDSLSGSMKSLIDRIMKESDPETATRTVSLLEDDFAYYAFERLPAGSDKTLYYTMACALKNSGLRRAKQDQMMQGDFDTSTPVLELTLTGLDGQKFDLSDFRGKWVILDFWVSWCGPCRRGFEKMKELYAEYSDKLEIVAIACGDQNETWSRLIEELKLPWINLLAPSPEANDGTVAGLPVPAYPTKVVIDPDGRIRHYIIGEDEELYERLEAMIAANN